MPFAINSINLAFTSSNYVLMKQYDKYNEQADLVFCLTVNKKLSFIILILVIRLFRGKVTNIQILKNNNFFASQFTLN